MSNYLYSAQISLVFKLMTTEQVKGNETLKLLDTVIFKMYQNIFISMYSYLCHFINIIKICLYWTVPDITLKMLLKLFFFFLTIYCIQNCNICCFFKKKKVNWSALLPLNTWICLHCLSDSWTVCMCIHISTVRSGGSQIKCMFC